MTQSPEQWTPLSLLKWTTDYFTKQGLASPRVDAELLLSNCLRCQRIELYTQFEKPVSPEERERFKGMLKRRVAREPLQHILGYADFYGRRFKVNSDVLIPRPETEGLLELALKEIQQNQIQEFLEIGVGSGCLSLSVLAETAEIRAIATDINPKSLEIARHNAEELGLSERIKFFQADLYPPNNSRFKLIISNPPYIPTHEIAQLTPEVKKGDPLVALDGGDDGLAIYRRLFETLPEYLEEGGVFLGEFGDGQERDLSLMASNLSCLKEVHSFNDLAGKKRYLKIIF